MAGINIDKLNAQYNNQQIKLETNDGKKVEVNTSIFSNLAVTSDVKAFLARFDADKNGKLSEKESLALKKVLVDYAGKDKVLDKTEFAKMVSMDQNSKDFQEIYAQYSTLVQRQSSGSSKTVQTLKDGSKVTSNFNADGSGTQITEKKDNNGNPVKTVITYGKDGVKIKAVTTNSTGTITTEYTNNENGNAISAKTTLVDTKGHLKSSETTKYTYNAEGKRLSSQSQQCDAKGKPVKTINTEYKYNSEGNLASSVQTTVDSNMNKTVSENTYDSATKKVTNRKLTKSHVVNGKEVVSKVSDTQMKYNENGRLIEVDTKGTLDGKPFSGVDIMADDGKTVKSRQDTYYKGDKLYKDFYSGSPNIENRMKGSLPNERIIYGADGKTVEEKIVNKFDEKGIIIARETYDKDNKLVSQKDFSKLDGHYDISYQGGRGDCFLLVSINSLAQTPDGQNLLKKNVVEKKDANGEVYYEVTLPGAQKTIDDIKSGKTKGVLGKDIPEDKMHIQGTYKITQKELEEAAKKSGVSYSSGDKDVLLYEVTYEKYRNDVAALVKDNGIDVKKARLLPGLRGAGANMGGDGDNLSGGTMTEANFILTGNAGFSCQAKNAKDAPVCYVAQPDLQMSIPSSEKGKAQPISDPKFDQCIDKLIEDAKDGKIDNYAASVGMNISQQEVNGEVVKGGGHAFSIKSITKDQVILANPWDPEKDIVMSMEEFKKAATSFDMVPVNENGKSDLSDIIGNNNTGGVSGKPDKEDSSGTRVVVKRGDSLWKIAKRKLGKGASNNKIANLVQKIIKANPQIKNPNLIHIGDNVIIPE